MVKPSPNPTQVLKPNEYKSKVKPTWCPGCGDFGLLSSLYQAMSRLRLDPSNTIVVSGIGCSSRLPFFVRTYGFQTVHGRVLPVAMGLKVANPDLTVIAVGGDGDGFSIGAGHLAHAVRRNPDITYVVMDNEVYGLTKGQTSPTSPLGFQTKSTPRGSSDAPLNPMAWVLASGVSFAARGFSGMPKDLTDLIMEGIRHRDILRWRHILALGELCIPGGDQPSHTQELLEKCDDRPTAAARRQPRVYMPVAADQEQRPTLDDQLAAVQLQVVRRDPGLFGKVRVTDGNQGARRQGFPFRHDLQFGAGRFPDVVPEVLDGGPEDPPSARSGRIALRGDDNCGNRLAVLDKREPRCRRCGKQDRDHRSGGAEQNGMDGFRAIDFHGVLLWI